MPERYVRPPLLGSEPRSMKAAEWRFRVVGLAVLLAIAALLAWLGVSLVDGGQDPGLGARPAAAALRLPLTPR